MHAQLSQSHFFYSVRVVCVLIFLWLIQPNISSANDTPLNINTALPALLIERLPGIGPAKAKAIVLYREQQGPFETIDQLLEVKGIGPKILSKIRQLLFIDAKDLQMNRVADTSGGNGVAKKRAKTLGEQEATTRRAVRAAVIVAKKDAANQSKKKRLNTQN